MTSALSTEVLEVGGTAISVTHGGTGPLIIFCHGFPETAHSWRAQLDACLSWGYHPVALDMLGYGQSDAPADPSRYNIIELVGIVVELVQNLKHRQAVIVGHDWGAPVAWHAALFRPDIFVGVVGMSVPFNARRSTLAPTAVFQSLEDQHHGEQFYMNYFQRPGVAEAELEADPSRTIRAFFYGRSPQGSHQGWSHAFTHHGSLIGSISIPKELPSWLSEEDIETTATAFRESGFTGPLNYYRNLDTNWRLLAPWDGVPINTPSLFLVGAQDLVRSFSANAERHLGTSLGDLRGHHVLDGVGHWIQQEAPGEVNGILKAFLDSLARW